ncbi:MAG: glycosyltransferase [Cyanobacteria bacterium CRU_2_1]|nr:glycosyltransferase [Cyanobacteria bacterium CRU_2_1]
MDIKKVVVTGNAGFLRRHQLLFKEMSNHFEQIECLSSGDLSNIKVFDLLLRGLIRGIDTTFSPQSANRFWINERTFITRSQQTERKIRRLGDRPDLIFHIFGLFSPFWDQFDIPYVMYLDYTMALAHRNWLPWSPFNTEQEFASWINCERVSYRNAHHLFTMGSTTQHSLVEDYGIEPEKITAVGSSGNCELYEGKKSFGNQQILFNGSDFTRKGGELVLTAFKQLRKSGTEIQLVIIGKKLPIQEAGVINPGNIASRLELQNLFLNTDLVVAPAHCDPFPTFLMEAMNYGVPCIVSAVDGMPEIVDNHVNGVVLEQPTSDRIARQIEDLLTDIPRLMLMSENARHKIRTQLNWKTIANTISNVLSTQSKSELFIHST